MIGKQSRKSTSRAWSFWLLKYTSRVSCYSVCLLCLISLQSLPALLLHQRRDASLIVHLHLWNVGHFYNTAPVPLSKVTPLCPSVRLRLYPSSNSKRSSTGLHGCYSKWPWLGSRSFGCSTAWTKPNPSNVSQLIKMLDLISTYFNPPV